MPDLSLECEADERLEPYVEPSALPGKNVRVLELFVREHDENTGMPPAKSITVSVVANLNDSMLHLIYSAGFGG